MGLRYENKICKILLRDIKKVSRNSSEAFTVPCHTGKQFRNEERDCNFRNSNIILYNIYRCL